MRMVLLQFYCAKDKVFVVKMQIKFGYFDPGTLQRPFLVREMADGAFAVVQTGRLPQQSLFGNSIIHKRLVKQLQLQGCPIKFEFGSVGQKCGSQEKQPKNRKFKTCREANWNQKNRNFIKRV